MLDPTPLSLAGTCLEVSGNEFTLELSQPDGPLCDHFPGSVLVPGFMQVDWIAAILHSHFAVTDITSVIDVKFLAPIHPPTKVYGEIRIESQSEAAADGTPHRLARFTLRAAEDGTIHSKGSLSII